MFRLWITLMRWSWRRSCCVVSMLMVLNDHLLFSSEPSCPALWAMMLLLKLNLVQERQLHSPSRFFSRLTLNWMSARLWCWPQLANWRSRSRRYWRYFSSSVGCIFLQVYPPLFQVVLALGDYMDAQCHACIGGTNVREDLRKLSQGVHVVVGTPGRVFDMINRRALSKILFFSLIFHFCKKNFYSHRN